MISLKFLIKVFNNFLLARDKFIPKLHLRQAGFTYRACGLVTKHRESIQKFRETGDLKHIYKNELEKISFDYDAA